MLSIICLVVSCMHNHFSVWYRDIRQLTVPIQTRDQTDASIKLCYSSRKNQQDFFISWGDRRVVSTRYIFPDWIHILDLNLHPWSHNCCKFWSLDCLIPGFNLGWINCIYLIKTEWKTKLSVSPFLFLLPLVTSFTNWRLSLGLACSFELPSF